MPMDYLTSLTAIFGPSATITGTGTDAVLSFKPSETGTGSNFEAPENAKPEALLLALLQRAATTQGITASRALEISKSTILGSKDGAQVTGEQYSIRIYSGATVTNMDPDAL